MNKYTFTDSHGQTWERVTRPTAKKAFINNDSIMIIACNLRPFTMWHCDNITTLSDEQRNADADGKTPAEIFDRLTMYFEIYNCINTETGKRPAYYIRRGNA